MLKKVTVAVLACLTLFLSKRSMSDGPRPAERRATVERAAHETTTARRAPSAVALF